MRTKGHLTLVVDNTRPALIAVDSPEDRDLLALCRAVLGEPRTI